MSLSDIMRTRQERISQMIEVYMLERNEEEKKIFFITYSIKLIAMLILFFVDWKMAILLILIAIPENIIKDFIQFMKKN